MGELAGIGASLFWAVSCLIFSRAAVPAGAMNLYKNAVASVLFVLVLAAAAASGSRPVLSANAVAAGWLILSSVIGIVVGDIFYFRCLQILGARRATVVATLVPPLGAWFGWLVLGERMTWYTGAGMAATLAGVAVVMGDAALAGDAPGHFPGSMALGVVYGFLASLCQVGQAVLSKLAMAEGVAPFEAAAIRIVTAACISLLVGAALRRLRGWRSALFAPGVPSRLAFAAVCGTFLGIWFSLIAFHHSPLAVATTLTTLSPIFVLPLAAVFLGQRISRRAVLGFALALAGVVVLSAGFESAPRVVP